NPKFSAVLTQLGAVDKKYDHVPASPQLQVGGSFQPPVEYGIWELGGNLTFRSQYEKWTDLVRLATSYSLGATQYVASFSEKNYALSFLLKFKAIRGGLTYDY